MKKLIIWDFDGVISDTEHLWIENWNKLLNKHYGVDWDFNVANKYLGGISVESKIENLKKLGIEIDQDFMKEIKEVNFAAIKYIQAIPGVEDLFKLDGFEHCIATGGSYEKTKNKLDVLDFNKYFPFEHIFTAKQVKNGKPEPDLFLYAAEKMGYSAKNSIVIEDSIAGLTAGLKAGILTIAYLGCDMNHTPENIQKVRDLGIKHIYFNMQDLRKHLEEK